MKNNLSKVLVVLLALSAGAQINAYRYAFSNHTKNTYAIGMRYHGINEPLEIRTIAPNERKEFRPGDPDIARAKFAFVVSEFFYIKNPNPAVTQNNKNERPWTEFKVTFVPSESYDLAIKLAEAVGKTTEEVGKTAAQAAAASATGGASAAASGAASLASKVAGSTKDAKSGAFGLSGLLNAIGQVAARSMAADRHMDIVEDENGKTRFISLL